MPKLAATLASLLLMASSIGVNIARYPQVGRTTDTAQAGIATTSSSLPAVEPKPASKTTVPKDLPTKKAERPSSEADSPLDVTAQEPVNGTPPAPTPIAVPIIDVRPTAPPGGLQAAGEKAPADRDEVHRLPPIEKNAIASSDGGGSWPDSNVKYPTTATP